MKRSRHHCWLLALALDGPSACIQMRAIEAFFYSHRSPLANAMTLTIAGVPASNLSGALAQITQVGETSLAAPPPVWKGVPLGNALLSTANARTPNGRPMSWLDTL